MSALADVRVFLMAKKVAISKPPVVHLNARQQIAADALKKTIVTPPKGGGPSAVELPHTTPRGLSPTAGRADSVTRRASKIEGDSKPQFDMTPTEWNNAHPNATAEQKKNFRDAYDQIGRTREARGLSPAGSSNLSGGLPTSTQDETPPNDQLQTQARVGGTKGATAVVDRSEAVRKSWDTRKKIYGPSGEKAK